MSTEPTTSTTDPGGRIVLLIDMDCFYCQVEEKLDPTLAGQPVAVVQHGGGLIAVNYAARAAGVTRHMRAKQAQQLCPAIRLASVPNVRGKADTGRYREAGQQVATVLQTFTELLERASVDEAYLDVTQSVRRRRAEMEKGTFVVTPDMLHSTYAIGYKNIGHFVHYVAKLMVSDDQSSSSDSPPSNRFTATDNHSIDMLIAATVCNEIRTAVRERTGYTCSAGMAHNKILAKLVCGVNKPNKQTLLTLAQVPVLYETLEVRRIRGLGGKFGAEVCERLAIRTMAQLRRVELSVLRRHFEEKNALFLHNIARGCDNEPVQVRLVSANIGCSKRFPGAGAIKTLAALQHWLGELAAEICERLADDRAQNGRRPRNLTVSFTQVLHPAGEVASSRTVPLSVAARTDGGQLAAEALAVIRRNTEVFLRAPSASAANLNNAIRLLGISVGRFESEATAATNASNAIRTMFSEQVARAKKRETLEVADDPVPESFGNLSYEEVVDCASDVSEATIDEEDNASPPNEERTAEVRQQNDESPDDETAIAAMAYLDDTQEEQKPKTDAAKVPAYMREYAEFHAPSGAGDENEPPDAAVPEQQLVEAPTPAINANAEPRFERCATCNKRVPLPELQSHADAHYAFQLSQQQRREYRDSISANASASKAATAVARTKRIKLMGVSQTETGAASSSSSSSSSAAAARIERFLVLAPKPEAPHAGGDLERCPECEKSVPAAEMQLHADYHAARRLQRELNESSGSSSSSIIKKKTAKAAPAAKSRLKSVAHFFRAAQ